ncbi:MAG: type IX secretion system sortase PorU [Bacteroidales bacterium]|nr:type IX secretion system sortase PorU [Bacteroidales bacterium]
MKKISILFFLFIAFSALSQERYHRFGIQDYHMETRVMNADISAHTLDFEGAYLDDNFGLLPVYIHRFPLKEGEMLLTADITGEHSSLFEHPWLGSLPDRDKIGSHFTIQTDIVYREGRPYGEVMVLPFRKLEENTVEVLDSCTIRVFLAEAHAGAKHSSDFVENSVLSSGKWYKIATDENGVYKIAYDDLQAMGIDPENVDPLKIRIFGNGNGMVPEKNADPRLDDLQENAIYVSGEEDGVFNEDDYILFYGQSPITWEYIAFNGYGLFRHQVNFYTDKTYYFLNINQQDGKRIPLVPNPGLVPNVIVEEFSDYRVHENDTVNILKTGREWYGERFGDQTSYDFTFSFPNIVEDYPVSLKTSVAAHSTEESVFDFYYNDQHLVKATIQKIIIGTTVYAWTAEPDTIGFYPTQGDDITIRIDYDKPVSTSLGWLNYISLNARRHMVFTQPFMSFRDHLGYGNGNVAKYRLSGANEQIVVWDVSDPMNVEKQDGTYSDGVYSFVAHADEIREYIAFDGSGFNSVEFIEEVQNQNLHAYEPVDYIIVSHPDFMNEAERMLSLHQQLDQLTGFIVTPQEIYNEFSSGKQDPAAIRDFVRMLWERADSTEKNMYLLLLGDASYDYKDRVPGNTNFVPAYQSREALKLGYSFVTDDFFGCLDPAEGANGYGKSVDIGIGRFPVHTKQQAEDMVDKVETYLTMKPAVLRPWRNDIYFIAHDGDQNLHFNQAEKLQAMIETGQPEYNRFKIYCDAFPLVSTTTGDRYPEVNDAIDRMMADGCLIVNYTGHGGESGWAYQSILDIPMINSWTNWDRLPLFITATCEFSRYDEPSIISAGEWVFLNPDGGGIGLLTTSRLAWADPNFRLNKSVYNFMFDRPDGKNYKIGDVVRLAKTEQNNGTNIKNFVLLGDPAMRLAYPENRVLTLKVNNEEPVFNPDTLTSMSEVSLEGLVVDYEKDTLDDFNGVVFIKLFDHELTMSTLGNRPGSIPSEFNGQGQILHEGMASVVNGRFQYQFFMPQNMVNSYGRSRFSYYAYDTVDNRDAHGYSRVWTGGVTPDIPTDKEGPAMSLYMNNTDFVSGGLTDSDPVFLAYLHDEHGINFTGNGIGRDITLTLDGKPESAVVLNDHYDPDIDSYQSGWISYPLNDLPDGKHTLTLKAWDIMNNVSEKTIEFVVSVDGQLSLTQVMNYPNPFSDKTYFTYKHNKPGNSFDIEIRIFSVNGQFVEALSATSSASGLSIPSLEWDATDSGGNKIGSGIYIYRLYVTDEQGTRFVQTSKLIYTGKQ